MLEGVLPAGPLLKESTVGSLDLEEGSTRGKNFRPLVPCERLNDDVVLFAYA